MGHQGIDTFRYWPRARPLNIKTTVVLGQSFSKVSVINVHSRAPCPSLPLWQFCWVCSFYGMIRCRQVTWTFQVSIVAYYYQSAKCTRWDVTSSIRLEMWATSQFIAICLAMLRVLPKPVWKSWSGFYYCTIFKHKMRSFILLDRKTPQRLGFDTH